MIYRASTFTMIIVITSCFVYGQNLLVANGLNIGDQAPDFVFKNAENLSRDQVKLSDFKGKLVILDFWATSCGSCLSAMPKMDSLQRVFKNQLQIILLTETESLSKVKTFLKAFRNDEIKTAIASLPNIYDDIRWANYFPHRSVPHHVWIGMDGKVVAITNGYNTNEKNITDFLKGRALAMRVKNDFLDTKYPDLILKSGAVKPTISSAFYPYAHNLAKNLYIIDSANGTFSRRNASATLPSIAKEFYFASSRYRSKMPKFLGYALSSRGGNRIIYQGKVMDKLSPPRDLGMYDAWKKENMFIYEITLPSSFIALVPEIGKMDVSRYAMIKYNIEIREIEIETDCYVLKFNDVQKFRSRIEVEGLNRVSDTLLKISNMPFENIYSNLCDLLEIGDPIILPKMDFDQAKGIHRLPERTTYVTGLFARPVVFDTETPEGKFDLELKGNLRIYKELKRLLASQGIDLSVKKRRVKYLVFTDLLE